MDKEKKYHAQALDSSSLQIYGIGGAQHSTKFGQSRLVTATQLKYRVLLRVARRKVVGEVLRKYGMSLK
jgi:hypothetical protein